LLRRGTKKSALKLRRQQFSLSAVLALIDDADAMIDSRYIRTGTRALKHPKGK
jgi:hypothetical protein